MAITKIGTPELFDFSATNTALQLPNGDTASRPSAPSAGEWRYNTEKKYVEYYDGASWFQIDTEALPNPDDFPSQNFNVSTYSGIAATQTIDAKFNEAANFSGAATSNIIIPNNAFPRASANTLAFWVKFANTSDSDKLIFYSYNTSNATRYYIGQAGSYITFRNADNSSITNVSSSLTANVWAHFAAVSDGAGNYVFYTNGSQSATGSFTNLTDDPTLQKFGDEWKGFLDQTRIYNTNLDATQVNYIYTNETTTTASQLNPSGFPSGCIAAYQLDGDALDVSGNYNGAVSNVGFTGLQFQPDFVWIKNRTFANSPQIIDSVRGVTKQLITSTADAEQTYTNGLTAFTANGFTVGSLNDVNKDGDKLVAWSLKAGGAPTATNTQAAGSSPTPDSVLINGVSSTAALAGATPATNISANTGTGFSIVKYTGPASNSTIAHALGVTPSMIIQKPTSSGSWYVYFAPGVIDATSTYYYMVLDSSAGIGSTSSAAPTTTTFNSAGSGAHIAYCFADIAGYQRISTYTGNASTYGEFVYTTSDGTATGTDGFEPAFLLVKRTTAGQTGNWRIVDNKRSTQNPRQIALFPNLANAEDDDASQRVNFFTNGFQIANSDASWNASGETYLYLAIGSNPAPTPTLANSLKTVAYTGDGVNGRSVNDVGFLPQFTWIKNLGDNLAGTSESHVWIDQLRYPTNIINSNEAIVQYNNTSSSYQSFIGNGFTLGNDGQVNSSAANYISYSWKGASIPTINNAGTITSVTSVNDAAGFSVVAYKGTGANATVGHGLQTAPQLILFKAGGSAVNWVTYNVHSTATKYMSLNLDYGDYSSAAEFQNTEPTGGANGVITIGTSGNPNSATYPMVAYCFHDISGYQKVGTYTGTGATLNQIYTTDDGTSGGANGFAPSVVIFKCTSNDGTGWRIFDTTRGTDSSLTINNSNSQYIDPAGNYVDFTSSGFEFNNTGYTQQNPDLNGSGYTYIYLAIK